MMRQEVEELARLKAKKAEARPDHKESIGATTLGRGIPGREYSPARAQSMTEPPPPDYVKQFLQLEAANVALEEQNRECRRIAVEAKEEVRILEQHHSSVIGSIEPERKARQAAEEKVALLEGQIKDLEAKMSEAGQKGAPGDCTDTAVQEAEAEARSAEIQKVCDGLKAQLAAEAALAIQDAESFARQKRELSLRVEDALMSERSLQQENQQLKDSINQIESISTAAEQQTERLHQKLDEAMRTAMESDKLSLNLSLAQAEVVQLREENRLLNIEIEKQGVTQQTRQTLLITELKNQLRDLSEEADYKDDQLEAMVSKVHGAELAAAESHRHVNEIRSELLRAQKDLADGMGFRRQVQVLQHQVDLMSVELKASSPPGWWQSLGQENARLAEENARLTSELYQAGPSSEPGSQRKVAHAVL